MFLKFIRFCHYLFVGHFVSSLYPIGLTNRLKRKLLISLGLKIGKNPMIHLGVFISSHNKIRIGDNLVLSKDVMLMGNGGIEIGDNTLIGYSSKILTGNHIIPESIIEPIRFSGHKYEPIKIGTNVWIGANCIILPGVQIGDNTIVAAGAIVTKSFSSNLIIGGIPAKIIKKR